MGNGASKDLEEQDKRLQNEQNEIEKTKFGKIDEHFERNDLNGNGFLEANEVKSAIKSYIELHPDNDLTELVNLIDEEEKILIKKNEYRKLMMSYLKEDPDYEDWLDTFQIFDKNLSGGVSSSEIRYVFSKLGLNITEDEAEEMIKELNPYGQSLQIGLEDFLRVMLSN